MSRSGITEEEVLQAADTLTQSGKPVTIATVREALGGTGSYTTISKYLAVWREKQGRAAPTPVPDIPPEVEGMMMRAMQSMWAQATTQASKGIEEMKTATAQRIAEKDAELEEARQEIARLETAMESVQAASQKTVSELSQAKEKADAHAITIARLEERLERLEGEITELREAFSTTTKTLETEREEKAVLKERLEAEAKRRQAQEGQMLSKLEMLSRNLDAVTKDRDQARDLITELRAQIGQAESRAQSYERRADELAIQVKELQGELVKLATAREVKKKQTAKSKGDAP